MSSTSPSSVSKTYDISLQSLWKTINGLSAITNHDLIIDIIDSLKETLSNGLAYFKQKSSKSLNALKSSKSVTGQKLEFIILISEHLELDEILSRNLFQNFLIEGYRGSVSDVNHKLTNEDTKQQLLTQVEDYYHRERLYLLRCIKQFFGYWQDGNHPYREVYEKALVKIDFDGAKFIPGIWKQFEEVSLCEIPKTIQSAYRELKWLKQTLLEQIEMMEILLLFYKDYEMSAELMTEKFKLFQRIGYGLVPRGRYSPGIHGNDPLPFLLSSLCVLVLLEGLDLEYLLQQENYTGPRDHHLSKSTKYEQIETALKEASVFPCQYPLFLAWFILRYKLLEDEDSTGSCDTTARYLGNQALRGGVFEVISTVLRNPCFIGERPVSGVCQSMYYTIVSLAVMFFSEESLLTDPKVLYDIASCVLNHPRMRIMFWEKGLNKELGLLVTGLLRRFPDSTAVDMLISLAQDNYSANKVFTLVDALECYCEELVPHSLAGVLEIGPDEGTWQLRVSREILQPEYHTLGLAPLVLDRGTVGVVLEESSGEGNVQLVSWIVAYSGWSLLAALVQGLLNTPGVTVDPEPHPLIEFVTKMYRLVTEIVRYSKSIAEPLKPVVFLIYSILQKFPVLPHPPVELVSCCLDCLSVIMDTTGDHTLWNNLRRSKFTPQFITPYDKNSLHTSPESYGLLLNNWERARGVYPVTMAMLRLLKSSLSSGTTYHDNLVSSIIYIMQTVFTSSHNWRYQNQLHRDKFCYQLLSLCCLILTQNGVTQAKEETSQKVLHKFVVDLLLHSSGHLLLINIMSTGVDIIDRLTASAISSSQPSVVVQSLKLCFTITDLLLQTKSTTQSVTVLEQALATCVTHHPSTTLPLSSSLSSSQHLVTGLFNYIHHRDDPMVPVGAIKLLGSLATVAPMSMFSCIGDEAMPLKDCIITRLSAISENVELRKAILQFVSCCIGTQPGLLELLISLKPSSPTTGPSHSSTGPSPSKVGVYTIDQDSCLWPVVDMIDPGKQCILVPPALLCTGTALLRSLWQARHVGALRAVPASRDKFWKHVTGLLTEKINMEGDADSEVINHKLLTAGHVMYLVATELYYVIQNQLDKSLKTGLQEFAKKDGYSMWTQCLRNLDVNPDVGEPNVGVVVSKRLKVQEKVSESWRALVMVAANHHEGLFELHSPKRRKMLLTELMNVLESQVELLPQSVGVMTNVLNLYLSLTKKWESVESLSPLSRVLEKVTKCEGGPEVWELSTLVYSIIVIIMATIKKNESDIESRFVSGFIPSIQNTLENHTHFRMLTIKHYPELYAVLLLSEVTQTLPDNDPLWLDTLREHCIIMILTRTATGYLDTLSRPDLVDAILGFFLNLSNSSKGAEMLQVNNISHLLTIPLGNVVSKLNTVSSNIDIALSKVCVPPPPDPNWMRVWLIAVKLETRLLNVLSHHFLDSSLDFVGVHHQRLQHCLDIHLATRYLLATEEAQTVCQLLQQLVQYREQWMYHLLHQHNQTINRIVYLLNGSVGLLSRGRLKDVIKTMDSQGLLKPEHGSASVKALNRQRRASGGQVVISSDDDSWVRCSPAYLELHNGLVSIVTSCVTVLNFYSPPLSDIFMCTFTKPVDLTQWPDLFVINSMLPVIDPTSPPSINTLTATLTVGSDILRKLDPQGGSRGPARSPSKTSPAKSPVTPFIPRLSSEIMQQKKNEILYMLEQTVSLLISQSLRYLLDDRVSPIEKQALKKHLVSELSNFCQSLHISFSRKGVPSPHSSSSLRIATPLSSSSTTFHDSLSGRTSSHSFTDTLEQGMFKLADMFAKNLTR